MKKYPLKTTDPFPNRPKGLSTSQLKALRFLKTKKGRNEQGQFLIEGAHLCAEALQSGHRPILLLYTQSGFQSREIKETVVRAQRCGLPNLRVSDSTLKTLTDAKTPQGIMAVMEKPAPKVVPGSGKIFVLLDQVRDPGNVGTIIRTADAAGVDGVYLTSGAVDLYNPKVLRATQGSIFHISVGAQTDPLSFVEDFKNKGFRLLVADPRAKRLYTEVRYPGRFILMLGNETRGVRQEIGERADGLIRVPIRGQADSLNVALACGVILYEALRQRMKKKGRTVGRRKRRTI
jgi:TrmH family RNA methyltransferase